MVTLGDDVSRHTFVVIRQADDRFVCYEEVKKGPGEQGVIEPIPHFVADTPGEAMVELCRHMGEERA